MPRRERSKSMWVSRDDASKLNASELATLTEEIRRAKTPPLFDHHKPNAKSSEPAIAHSTPLYPLPKMERALYTIIEGPIHPPVIAKLPASFTPPKAAVRIIPGDGEYSEGAADRATTSLLGESGTFTDDAD